MKNWFITGASTGLGRAITEAALGRGDRVAAVSIDPKNMQDYEPRFGKENVMVELLDVRQSAMVEKVFAKAVETFGHIDVVVNCAGYIQVGPVEAMSEAEVRGVFDTNFFGLFFVSKEAARHMRSRRSGTIIQISSLSGLDCIAGESMYGATKHAVIGMSQAFHQELREFGVKVVIVEPGPIHTEMAKRAQLCELRIPEYDTTVGAELERWSNLDGFDVPRATDPAKCAAVITKLADAENPPREIVLGSFAYDIYKETSAARAQMAEDWYVESASCDE